MALNPVIHGGHHHSPHINDPAGANGFEEFSSAAAAAAYADPSLFHFSHPYTTASSAASSASGKKINEWW